jgi:hypothetical protein
MWKEALEVYINGTMVEGRGREAVSLNLLAKTFSKLRYLDIHVYNL